MLLRRFYLQENEKAPVPKAKKNRELKTGFIPLDLTRYVENHELEHLERLYGEDLRKLFSSSPGLVRLRKDRRRCIDGPCHNNGVYNHDTDLEDVVATNEA